MSYKLNSNLIPFIKKDKSGALTAPVEITSVGVVVISLQEDVVKNVTKKDFGANLIQKGAVKGVATFSENGTVTNVVWGPVPPTTPLTRKTGSNFVRYLF